MGVMRFFAVSQKDFITFFMQRQKDQKGRGKRQASKKEYKICVEL